MSRRPRLRLCPERSGGIALIAVLGLLSLLVILALSVLETTRRHGQMLRNSMDSLQARELADSALRVALLEWSLPPTSSAANQTTTRSISLFGQSIPVALELEAGRIDLNAADPDLLTALFAAHAYPIDEAQQMADRIVDWRDVNDVPGIHGGAERAVYRQLGRSGAPRNAPFETISEVLSVAGVESLPVELLDAFTVYTHASEVRQSVAADTVAKALQWADVQRLGGRPWLTQANAQDSQGSDSLAGEVARLEACAKQNAVTACRRAIVRFTGNPAAPTLVFDWASVPARSSGE